MKLIAYLCAAILAAQPLTTIANAEVTTKEIAVNVSDVLVPSKVDHNSDAKIVLSGMFPNSCYSWSRAEVVPQGEFNRTVRGMALVAQTMCLMVLVPYTKEINLGKLPVGEHTLRFINGDETYFEKVLSVE